MIGFAAIQLPDAKKCELDHGRLALATGCRTTMSRAELHRCKGQIRRKVEAQNYRSKGHPTIAELPEEATLYPIRFRAIKHIVAFAVVAMLAVGCGDDSADGATAAAPTAAPSGGSGSGTGGGSGSGTGGGSGSVVTLGISGAPPTQIVEGTPIDFTPTVSNPDGVPLSFSAINLPSWASLNPTTGRIVGTPDSSEVGSYSGIRLTVSGGGASATTPAYTIEVVATALGSAVLSWVPPTQKTDGSPLDDLAGYKIYYGQAQDNLNLLVDIDSGGATAYVVQDLTPATWYFVATAYDNDGVESAFSNMTSKTIM
jgi:hypothetical protein